MKIIDEKGKVFGIINIIDLTVILVIGLLAVGGIKRMKKSPTAIAENKKAIIKVEVPEIRQATVDGIIVGDPLYHYDKGQYIGEIIDKKVEPYREALDSGDGEWILADVPEKYVVTILVEARVRENPDVIVAGGEQIRVGAQFRLKNRNVAVMSTMMGVEVE